jgi:hypothetical protein
MNTSPSRVVAALKLWTVRINGAWRKRRRRKMVASALLLYYRKVPKQNKNRLLFIECLAEARLDDHV